MSLIKTWFLHENSKKNRVEFWPESFNPRSSQFNTAYINFFKFIDQTLEIKTYLFDHFIVLVY